MNSDIPTSGNVHRFFQMAVVGIGSLLGKGDQLEIPGK
jgi:hypothetical protein